jgi:hypothetical protein
MCISEFGIKIVEKSRGVGVKIVERDNITTKNDI